jgi:hypothetical protein
MEDKAIVTINEAFVESRPLSYSSLKHFRKSPRHYIQYLTEPFVQSDEMRLGSLVDCLILEPERFEERFYLYVRPSLRSNAGKEEMEGLITQANGRMMIEQDTLDVAKICVARLLEVPESKIFFENKRKVQHTLKWTDRETGLPLVGKPDFDCVIDDTLFVCDLKTTRSADPEDFNRDIVKLDYILQCGMYLEGYHKRFYKFPEFVFICVETSPPYNVSVNYADPKFKSMAQQELRGTLKAFKMCMDKQLFELGYEFRLMGLNSYFSIHLPGYYRPKFIGLEDEE